MCTSMHEFVPILRKISSFKKLTAKQAILVICRNMQLPALRQKKKKNKCVKDSYLKLLPWLLLKLYNYPDFSLTRSVLVPIGPDNRCFTEATKCYAYLRCCSTEIK